MRLERFDGKETSPSEKNQEKAWSLSSVLGAHSSSEYEGMGHDLGTVAAVAIVSQVKKEGHGFSPLPRSSHSPTPSGTTQRVTVKPSWDTVLLTRAFIQPLSADCINGDCVFFPPPKAPQSGRDTEQHKRELLVARQSRRGRPQSVTDGTRSAQQVSLYFDIPENMPTMLSSMDGGRSLMPK